MTTTMLALLLVSSGWSQEEPQGEQSETSDTVADAPAGLPETTDDEPEAEEASGAAEIDDSDLDEQTYEEDDDDFVPTEEIPTDESIPFPSNI